MEYVDILNPPTFTKSGIVKTRQEAIKNGDWIGTFNLWIVQSKPLPAILYQQRSLKSTWAPGLLDVTAGGHYQAGESIYDGLREVREELGKNYRKDQLTYLSRKVHISPDVKGIERHNLVDIFFVIDNDPIGTYVLQKDEVYALVICPIDKLILAHAKNKKFTARGITNDGKPIELLVSKKSFPYNWDDYHYKIALLAKRFLAKEKNLVY